jgi:C4-dicarboxylate transporter DctM subunit
MALGVLFGSFLVFVAIGIPVAFCLGLATLLAVLATGDLPVLVIAQRMLTGIDSYTLLAIPFFLLAGEIMALGGIADRLIDFARSLLGHLRGGLAIASTLASIIFAGVSGSAAADVSAIGSVVIRPMIRDGYQAGFVASLQATAGMLGPIIPPSIIMIVYAAITNVSVAALFLSGVVPGLIIGAGIMLMAWRYAARRSLPHGRFVGWSGVARSLAVSIPALVAPAIIIVGIVGGVFTATEAGVIAVLYALIVSLVVYRRLHWSDLPRIFVRTGFTTATLMFIVATSSAFSYVLAYFDVPATVLGYLVALSSDKYVILLIVLGVIFVVGMVIDVIPAALILVPILHPLATQLGFDAIHFALIMVIALQAGGLTPPVGVLLFIACGLAEISPTQALRHIYPFVALVFGTTIALAFVPDLVLWLPRFALGR